MLLKLVLLVGFLRTTKTHPVGAEDSRSAHEPSQRERSASAGSTPPTLPSLYPVARDRTFRSSCVGHQDLVARPFSDDQPLSLRASCKHDFVSTAEDVTFGAKIAFARLFHQAATHDSVQFHAAALSSGVVREFGLRLQGYLDPQ